MIRELLCWLTGRTALSESQEDRQISHALAFERRCREAKGNPAIPKGEGRPAGIPYDTGGGNAYGTVWGQYDNGEQISVICGHGGSMWMCLDCAEAWIKGLPQPRPEQTRLSI